MQQQAVMTFGRRLTTKAFLEATRTLLDERPGVRPLILMDEWDEIYREEYRTLATNFREVVQNEQRISWLLASTWTLSAELSRYGSPWYNLVEPFDVAELDWNAASQLVDELSTSVGVTWTDGAVIHVLQQTGRRPYLLQLVCSKSIDYLTVQRSTLVDEEAVEVAIKQVMDGATTSGFYIGPIWQDAGALGRLILWAIDRCIPRYLTLQEIRGEIEAEFAHRELGRLNQDLFDSPLKERMIWLTSIVDAIAEHNGHVYTFSIPVVERWLHRTIAQQKNQIDAAFVELRQTV
jgi:hypothetical protein